MSTPQDQIRKTLTKAGIPYKEIKCYGPQYLRYACYSAELVINAGPKLRDVSHEL